MNEIDFDDRVVVNIFRILGNDDDDDNNDTDDVLCIIAANDDDAANDDVIKDVSVERAVTNHTNYLCIFQWRWGHLKVQKQLYFYRSSSHKGH
jgi:hypothetical protein